MVIQAMCRDYSLRIAMERNIKKPVYLIPINRISDRWVKLYMGTKAKKLKEALDNRFLPRLCNARERWHGRKCADYCDVVESCPYGRMVKRSREVAA